MPHRATLRILLTALAALPLLMPAAASAEEDFPQPVAPAPAAPAPAASASTYEAAPKATAAEALPAALRKGAHHTVRDALGADRLHYVYEIESPYGTYRVASRRLLEIRVREIETLVRVTNMEGAPEFFRSLGKSLAAIPTGAVELVLDPVTGFRRVGRGLAKTGRRVRDLFAGPKTSQYEGSRTGNAFYGDEQRAIAAELGLDVYSTNPQVREFLREMGSARAAGSLGVDLASLALPVVGFAVVTTAKWRADVTRLLRDKSPLELHRHNVNVLSKLGIPRASWERFLNNRALSPRHKTTITASVAEMAKVKDLAALLDAAATAHDEVGALYHEQQAILLAHVHREGGGLVSLRRMQHVVIGRQAVGRELAFLPVDRIYWMEPVAKLADAIRPPKGAEHATRLHLRGQVSERARKELEARGFELVTDFAR